MSKVYIVRRNGAAEHGPYFSNLEAAMTYIKYQKGAQDFEQFDTNEIAYFSSNMRAATRNHTVYAQHLYDCPNDADASIMDRMIGLSKLNEREKEALGL